MKNKKYVVKFSGKWKFFNYIEDAMLWGEKQRIKYNNPSEKWTILETGTTKIIATQNHYPTNRGITIMPNPMTVNDFLRQLSGKSNPLYNIPENLEQLKRMITS